MALFLLSMTNTIYAVKTGMVGKYTPSRERVGVTMVKVLPMVTESLRTMEKHKYQAVRYKIQDTRYKNKSIWREVRTDEQIELGKEIKIGDVLKVGDLVKVTGISKGKGTAGPVKRWGFKGGPRTHGQSNRERSPGSSGSTTTPGRVLKGKKRAGHMGVDKISIMGLKVLEVDEASNIVGLIGSVPGNNRGLLTLTKL